MKERRDEDGRVWIQGGTARIPAPGEPGGGPAVFDDTPPELKEHLKREENKNDWSFRSGALAQLHGDHYGAFAEARKTMGLGDANGFAEWTLKTFDADVVARAEGAPSDEARQRFVDDAMDLRGALETLAGTTESTFKDMKRRSDLGLKAGALARQARAYPEDYALHAAVLDKVADGAMPLVKRERAIQFRRVETEKLARSAVMGLIEQGRFDEGRALLATATNGTGGPGTLRLSPEAVEELGGVLEERYAEAAAREERLDRVDTVIEGTAGPTEDADEWETLVEEHFAVVAPQMAELEPAERIEVKDDYVRKLGHLPVPLMRSLRAGMLSGEPEHEAAAALRIAGFANHDPALIEAIPEAERAAAIAEFAELGVKPERAVELADAKLAEAEDDEQEEANIFIVIQRAVAIGRAIQNYFRVGRMTEKARKDEGSKPRVIEPETVLEVARKAFEDANRKRASEGKKNVSKVRLTIDDFGKTADDVGVIEGLVRATQDGLLIPTGQEVVEIRLGKVDAAFAARL